MLPSLAHGDQILVHLNPALPSLDGIYVIRFGEDLLVKQVSLNPATDAVSLISDNSGLYPPNRRCSEAGSDHGGKSRLAVTTGLDFQTELRVQNRKNVPRQRHGDWPLLRVSPAI